MVTKSIAVVGAGFSGAVVARELAEAGFDVEVFEARNHIAGNCHTERDLDTNVMVHVYGPHIFHTSDKVVWDYINRYGEMLPYVNRVKAVVQNKVFTLPINLLTINQFFSKCLNPSEAKDFLDEISDKSIGDPVSFQDQGLKFVGLDLYNAFFHGYTKKQWGRDPNSLPASILKRLPIRFNYDDNYFNHDFQGMPKYGYTEIIASILDHPSISVYLETQFNKQDKEKYFHTFYSGPLDKYFETCFGPLPYRTLKFEKIIAEGDYQGTAVINYCDESVPFTRIAEHKHFAPWESHQKTVAFREYSSEATEDDIPFYPISLKDQNEIRDQYKALAEKEANVTFMGRLGTYRYLDMDVTIGEALNVAASFLQKNKAS